MTQIANCFHITNWNSSRQTEFSLHSTILTMRDVKISVDFHTCYIYVACTSVHNMSATTVNNSEHICHFSFCRQMLCASATYMPHKCEKCMECEDCCFFLYSSSNNLNVSVSSCCCIICCCRMQFSVKSLNDWDSICMRTSRIKWQQSHNIKISGSREKE